MAPSIADLAMIAGLLMFLIWKTKERKRLKVSRHHRFLVSQSDTLFKELNVMHEQERENWLISRRMRWGKEIEWHQDVINAQPRSDMAGNSRAELKEIKEELKEDCARLATKQSDQREALMRWSRMIHLSTPKDAVYYPKFIRSKLPNPFRFE